MKLIDMKINKKKGAKAEAAVMAEKPDYPWGLRIDLGDEALKKLGLDASKLDAGSTVMLSAKATVTRTSTDVEGERKSQRVELQITHLSIEPGDKDDFDKAFAEATDGKK